MLADQLEDNRYFGADVLVMSSASSKTAYGAAFLLKGNGPEIVGLTSPGNVEFTESLGCYDRVVAYDEVSELDATRPTAYLDVLGSTDLRSGCARTWATSLVHDAVVGVTHQESVRRRRGSRIRNRRSSSRPTRCASAPATGAARSSTGGSPTPGTASRRSSKAGSTWWSTTGPRRCATSGSRCSSGKSAPRAGNIVTF